MKSRASRFSHSAPGDELKGGRPSSITWVSLNAGICAQRIGDDVAAEDYFRKSFSLDPANPATTLQLGELHLRRNELEKARFYSDRIIRNFDPSPDALWLALRIERKSGDRASEASYASQLRRRFPNSPQSLRMQQGQFE